MPKQATTPNSEHQLPVPRENQSHSPEKPAEDVMKGAPFSISGTLVYKEQTI